MTCWINRGSCHYSYESFFDSNISYCKKCQNFSIEDIEYRFQILGFTAKDPYALFTEEQLFSLEEAKKILFVILKSTEVDAQEDLIQVREIRKQFFRELNPNCSEKGLENLVKEDLIIYDFEEYIETLRDLIAIFDKE